MLQNTLVEVEASSGVSSDDPALVALKRVILRRIAHLELASAEAAEEALSTQRPTPAATGPSAVEVDQAVPAVPPANGDDRPIAAVPPPNEVAAAVAAAPRANEVAPARLEISLQEPNQETTSGNGGSAASPPSSPEQTNPRQTPS